MPLTSLDSNTALVLVDLQRGIVSMPAAHPVEEVVSNAARLVSAAHQRAAPIFAVRVAFSPDGGDALRLRTDVVGPAGPPPPGFADLVEELALPPEHIVITKRSWSAFYGTELDLQLRRRGITGLVIAGIATSLGVESTARSARDRAYNVTAAVDAMTDPSGEAHDHTVRRILPRLAEVDTTQAIVRALA
jgi:nicotinamidase-related amidase